jgi:hypothetical protein
LIHINSPTQTYPYSYFSRHSVNTTNVLYLCIYYTFIYIYYFFTYFSFILLYSSLYLYFVAINIKKCQTTDYTTGLNNYQNITINFRLKYVVTPKDLLVHTNCTPIYVLIVKLLLSRYLQHRKKLFKDHVLDMYILSTNRHLYHSW